MFQLLAGSVRQPLATDMRDSANTSDSKILLNPIRKLLQCVLICHGFDNAPP